MLSSMSSRDSCFRKKNVAPHVAAKLSQKVAAEGYQSKSKLGSLVPFIVHERPLFRVLPPYVIIGGFTKKSYLPVSEL